MAQRDAEHRRPPGLAWSWSSALLGAVYAVPAGLVAIQDVRHGLAAAVGVLPAAIAGLPARRRGRRLLVLLGVLTGVAMFVGGVLAGVPVVAVAAVFVLGVGAAWLAMHTRGGGIAMTLALPMVGVGLSYASASEAAALAGLMVAGSVYAYGVSLLWPERPPPASRPPGAAAGVTLGYGVRLGAAGASAAAIGFLLDFQHVGWACAAALLVMRPARDMQRLRSAGRLLAVATGALAAIAVLRAEPAAGWYVPIVVALIGGAAATRGSRWYVTPAFSTFLVFLLLLFSDPGDASWRLGERLGETALGVGIAYLFGLLLPAVTGSRLAERNGR
ncbi:MAG: FUSC family protein [Thermoleophilia bacterium]